MAERPSWFVPKLELVQGGTVVVLDDDASVHDVWERKLGKTAAGLGIKLVHLSTPEEVSRWYKKNTTKKEKCAISLRLRS